MMQVGYINKRHLLHIHMLLDQLNDQLLFVSSDESLKDNRALPIMLINMLIYLITLQENARCFWIMASINELN